MASINGPDSLPGTRPLGEEEKEAIRSDTISPLAVNDLAYNDPVGCLNVLAEDNYLVTTTHTLLAQAVLERCSPLHHSRARDVKGQLDGRLSNLELLKPAELATLKQQYQQASVVRRALLRKAEAEKQQAESAETLALREIGTNEDSLATDFDVEESSIAKLKAKVSLKPASPANLQLAGFEH